MGVGGPPVPPPVSAPMPPPLPPPAPPRSGSKQPMWLFAAIGLAVVVAAAILVVRSGDEDGSAVGASPSSSPSFEPSPSRSSPTAEPSATAEPSPTEAPPSGTTASGVPLGASCFYPRGSYGIDYPSGWFTPTQRAWVCQLFDPQPFVVEPNTEPPIVAVTVYVEDFPLEELLPAVTDPAFYEVLSTEQGTFGDAARPGTAVETVQIAELFFPAGTRTYSVLIDLLDRTIVVSTNDLALTDYEQNKQVVLAMAQSLSVAG